LDFTFVSCYATNEKKEVKPVGFHHYVPALEVESDLQKKEAAEESKELWKVSWLVLLIEINCDDLYEGLSTCQICVPEVLDCG
jgi:hypothetical protein